MAETFCGVVAAFTGTEPLRQAALALAAAGYRYEAYLPLGDEALVRQLRPRSLRDPVRLWTLAGGIFGGLAAFAMTAWMSADWPLVTGGKPVLSWPPFICVAFEMTVLYASLACTLGFLRQGRLPRLTLPAGFRARFTVDRFGLLVQCRHDQADAVARQLTAAGAEAALPVWHTRRGRLASPGPEDNGREGGRP